MISPIAGALRRAEGWEYGLIRQVPIMASMILFAILTRLGKKRAALVCLPLVSLFVLIHDVLAYSDLLASYGIKRETNALGDVIELLTSFVG